MICKNCGAEISDYSTFCTYCGKPTGSAPDSGSLNDIKEAAPPPGYSEPIPQDDRMPQPLSSIDALPEYDRTQTGYIPDFTEDVRMNGTTWAEINRMGYIVGENGQHYSIGWMKFILYFQVFASAVFAVINAVNFFRGADNYGNASGFVYILFPTLQGLDIVMGVFQLLIAAGLICSRFMITGLRKNGIWLFLGMHLLNLLLVVVYYCIFCSVTGISVADVMNVRTVANMLTSAVLIGVNYVYFRNRSSVFIH